MTYTVTGFKRLNRRDSVTGQFTAGPWHMMSELGQAWCGSRVRGFAADHRLTAPPEGRMCTTCEKAVAANQPKSFSRR